MFNRFYNSIGTYSKLMSNHASKLQNLHQKTQALAQSTVAKIIAKKTIVKPVAPVATTPSTTATNTPQSTNPVKPAESQTAAVPLPGNAPETPKS